MRIERLRLTDFRNYHALDLALPPGLIVLRGRNAQGKSNLLEAISLLATSRSFRTSGDREVVRWGAADGFARVEATVARRQDTLQVEVVVADPPPLPSSGSGDEGGALAQPPPAPPFRKRIRVNGAPRRAMDLLGLVPVVIFAPTDLDLVIGSPSERRRYLDMTLCQVRPAYCRALTAYQKVLTQRAALLRRIREGEEKPHALSYWDDQLASLAAPIFRERAAFLARAEQTAARVYAALASEDAEEGSGEEEEDGAGAGNAVAAGSARAPLRLVYQPEYDGPLPGDDAALAAGIRAQLVALRRREIAQGANVLGPHRDDIAFFAGDVNLAIFGSRGQQRSVALALKLAELRYIEEETGEQPALLLDDVLSELDARRRADLLEAVRDLDQTLLTTTDTSGLPADALARAHLYRVRAGAVTPITA